MFRQISLRLALVFLAVGLGGCFPSSENNVDEEKESHFVSGRSRASAKDFKGAIEEFEKALEANPHSAAAHFELGWLNEEQTRNCAAAIYHYERHLELRPNSAYAERAKERIISCKRELARSEIVGPETQNLQREIERLRNENLQLKRQVDSLQSQLASRPPANVSPGGPSAPVPLPGPTPGPVTRPAATAPGTAGAAADRAGRVLSQARPRTYVVKSGDTMTVIARQFGLRVSALQSANPQVDPRRIKVGQSLNIPAS